MKIKKDFVLRNIAGNWVALPLGNATIDFTGMLNINESGVILWRLLEGGCTREEMADALLKEYDVGYDEALADVDEFISKLDKAGCVDH